MMQRRPSVFVYLAVGIFLQVLNPVSPSGHSEAKVLILSKNAFFEASRDVLVIRPQDASALNLTASIRRYMHWSQETRVQVHLDGARLHLCEDYPCDVPIENVAAGHHKITVTLCSGAEETCGPVVGESAFIVKHSDVDVDLLEILDGRRQASANSLSHVDTSTSVPLTQIELLEYQDYVARHIISPSEVESVDGCHASSVCGVWHYSTREEGKGKIQCTDLCTDTRYLPDEQVLAQSVAKVQEESAEVYKDMFESQFPQHADPWDVRPSASPMSGFGVTMVYAAHNLAKAFATGGIFTAPNGSMATWTSSKFCGDDRSLSCYFLRVTNVSFRVVDDDNKPAMLAAEREGTWSGVDGIMHDFSTPKYAHKGSFWLQSHALSFIWRFNDRTRQYIESLRSGMNMKHPIIGIHVRRGDSFMAARWMPHFENFLREARAMKELYGVSNIFLATDDVETVEKCHALQDFECFSLPIDRKIYDVGASQAPEHNPAESQYDMWVERRIERGELDGSATALHAIAEIDTLSQCDYFIGRLDSAISRLAYMLMSASKGLTDDHLSVLTPYKVLGLLSLSTGRGRVHRKGLSISQLLLNHLLEKSWTRRDEGKILSPRPHQLHPCSTFHTSLSLELRDSCTDQLMGVRCSVLVPCQGTRSATCSISAEAWS